MASDHTDHNELADLETGLPTTGTENQKFIVGTTINPMRQLFAAITAQFFDRIIGIVKIPLGQFLAKNLIGSKTVTRQKQ